MEKPSSVVSKIDENLHSALREIEESEKHLRLLQKWIIESVMHIRKKALHNNAATIIDDVIVLEAHLDGLIGKLRNDKIKKDLKTLIQHLDKFTTDFVKNAELFESLEQKLNFFNSHITNALRRTLLRDLRQKDMELAEIHRLLLRESI